MTMKQSLELYHRPTNQLVLGPIDLGTREGRTELADFFTKQSGGIPLTCITSSTSSSTTYTQQEHQFGNTSSNWKLRGDTRTVHIVNAATIRQVSERIHCKLNPTRFRPNIVIDGPFLSPWCEFDWIGKQIQIGDVVLSIISKTVRCDGISIDPDDEDDDGTKSLDIPQLLVEHFPERGPYLGVYAVIETGGSTLSLDDTIRVLY